MSTLLGAVSCWNGKYPNRGPVLVDEAHNFRNITQGSRGLSDYLESGDHKVVLLSATPQNLGPMDIYRQLRLFLDDTEHGLNIEPVSLEEYFRETPRSGSNTVLSTKTIRPTERRGGEGGPNLPSRLNPRSQRSRWLILNGSYPRFSYVEGAGTSGTSTVKRRW